MGLARIVLESRNKRTILDPISNICIIGAFLLFSVDMFLFLPNIDEPQALEIVTRSAISLIFLVGGLIGMIALGVHIPLPQTRGGDIDLNISTTEWTLIIIWTAINLMAIVLINAITFQSSTLFSQTFVEYPDTLLHWVVFSTAIGWTEEVVFRGFMLPAISRASGNVVGVLTTTLAWVAFHGGVYGLSPEPLVIIFFTGLVLSVSYLATNYRLTTTMLPHGINNFIAVGTRGAIVEVPALALVVPLMRSMIK